MKKNLLVILASAIMATAIFTIAHSPSVHAQNTPPITVPSNLGLWGTTTITGTTTANIIAAPSSSTSRYYVDQLQCFNTSSTAVTLAVYADGAAATTVKGYGVCPPSAATGGIVPFSPPLQLNTGVAATIKASTSASTLYVNLHAYQQR